MYAIKSASTYAGVVRRKSVVGSPAASCPGTRLRVRASDDEDIVPVISGRRKKGFTAKEQEQLRRPALLGGSTIGDELAMIRERYVQAEKNAEQQAAERLTSSQWEGDEYIGGRWNTLSVLYLIALAAPAAVGLFAWLSYGKLWGITPGLY